MGLFSTVVVGVDDVFGDGFGEGGELFFLVVLFFDVSDEILRDFFPDFGVVGEVSFALGGVDSEVSEIVGL